MGAPIQADFGSDEFFRKVKHLWKTDQNEVMELLQDQVKVFCREIIWESNSGFYNVTKEDFEDYTQEAWIVMWRNMERFLSNPMNDPDSEGPHYKPGEKISLAKTLIRWAMKKLRDRKMGKNPKGAHGKRLKIVSLNHPPKGSDSSTPLGELIAYPKPGPAQLIEQNDSVRDALQELLSLPNASETLAAVAYVILNDHLGTKQSMNGYAEQLNQQSVIQIVEKIETILADNDMDPEWVLDFRRRIEKEGGDRLVGSLSAAKLANRKSDVQEKLRNKMDYRRTQSLKRQK